MKIAELSNNNLGIVYTENLRRGIYKMFVVM